VKNSILIVLLRRYKERMVGSFRLLFWPVLMQDGAPRHAAQYTQQELRERLRVISWPLYSLDLNSIESV
jgi:hypothetical protein